MKTLTFNLNSETRLPRKLLDMVPQSGAADDAIEYALTQYRVNVSPEDARAYVRSSGGWSGDELNDDAANVRRLLWIAVMDCKERKTLWFYMGE